MEVKKSSVADSLAKSIGIRLASQFTQDKNFWDLVDAEIREQLSETAFESAQIWPAKNGEHRVCVSVFGADEPLVIPFFVVEPNMPTSPTFEAQIEDTRGEIEALRLLAKDISDLANQAENALANLLK